MAGRSSRSFREEGRLADIEASLRPGDYLVVQFGHNDAYREKAERYVAPEAFGASLQPYLDAVTATGAEHAKSLYLWHGDKHDDAHLQQAGALRFARAFARLVLQSTDPRLDVLKAAFEEE